jgi:hypothetical protein
MLPAEVPPAQPLPPDVKAGKKKGKLKKRKAESSGEEEADEGNIKLVERRLNCSALDCKLVVPGSNPAALPFTAISVSP